MKKPTRGRITLRTAGASDAKKLFALIQANLEEGHLLPRTLGRVAVELPGDVLHQLGGEEVEARDRDLS